MKTTFILLFFFILPVVFACSTNYKGGGTDNSGEPDGNKNGSHLSTRSYVRDIVNHAAFEGFGELLLTRDNNSSYYNTLLSNVGSLMPYHGHVHPEVVVGALNHLIDEVEDGKTVFYDFYTPEQKQADASKGNTGLFFYRGERNAPFAIVCPGGGFSYVGSLHEGFPLAQEISREGYNAFVIRYRLGSERYATEDLAAAIAFVFNNAERLEVSTENYSLWGGSGGNEDFSDETGDNTENPAEGDEIYLWQEGNMPATTSYQTVANSSNPDGADFCPNMIEVAANPNVPTKGAILICAGGAFQFRGNSNEGFPVAERFSELGYQCFVVNYRLRPYTQQEGALDLARAVRYVRSRAEEYGINEQNIAVIGFSAGGILCGELLLNFKGLVNGTSLDADYVPDELDNISADASAIGHIYSFYGRLSVASIDVELFRRSSLPPAFFVYGTRDPFVSQFAACVNALREARVPTEDLVLQDWPHGFGAGDGGWISEFDRWLMSIFINV